MYDNSGFIRTGWVRSQAPNTPKPEPSPPPSEARQCYTSRSRPWSWSSAPPAFSRDPPEKGCTCHISCKTCVAPGEDCVATESQSTECSKVGSRGLTDSYKAKRCLVCADGSLPLRTFSGPQDGRGTCHQPMLTLRECTRDFTDYLDPHSGAACDCTLDGMSNAVLTGRRGCAHDSWGRFFCFTKGNCSLATRSTKYVSADGKRAAMFRPCSPPPNVRQAQQLRLQSPDCASEAAQSCQVKRSCPTRSHLAMAAPARSLLPPPTLLPLPLVIPGDT